MKDGQNGVKLRASVDLLMDKIFCLQNISTGILAGAFFIFLLSRQGGCPSGIRNEIFHSVLVFKRRINKIKNINKGGREAEILGCSGDIFLSYFLIIKK